MVGWLRQLLSLKARVTLLSLGISVLTLWALSYYASQGIRRDAERLLGEQQLDTVSLVAAQINRELVVRFSALQKVAVKATPSVIKGKAATQAFLEEHQALQMLFNGHVFVTGIDGIRLATTPYHADRIGTDLNDRDYIRHALDEGKASVGKPIIARPFLSPVVVMATPIFDNKGKIIGSLSGVIELNAPNFLEQVQKGHYGKTGYFLLVSPAYRLIVTATEKDRVLTALPQPGAIPAVDRYLEGFQGSAIYTNPKGIEVLASAKSIPAAGWVLLVTIPTAEAFAAIEDMKRFMLFSTIFLTLIAGALTWWVIRRQLRPLQNAVDSLNAQSNDQQAFTPLPIERQDEIGRLIGGFNQVLETLQQRESSLLESEARFRVLHDASFSGLVIHENTKILDCNQSFSELMGYSRQELIGMDGYRLITPESKRIVEHRIASGDENPYEVEGVRKDGTRYPLSIQGKAIPYKGRSVRVTEFRDITEQKRAEAEIHQLAFYDGLTGLPNRQLLCDRIAHALAKYARQQFTGAVLFVDVDHFQRINDTQGREVGDLLLQQISQRLRSCVGEGDSIARVGSGQFVILLEELSDKPEKAANEAEALAEKVLFALHQCYEIKGTKTQCTVCIGIALLDANLNTDELLSRAELAMTLAKSEDSTHLRFFDPKMQALVIEQSAMEADLRQALLNDEFVLFYQLQIDLDGRTRGAEVLLRWKHPKRGMVSPAEFIPLTEETGLIIPIGQWVLETACHRLAIWASRPEMSHLTIAVNVSARQFHHANFVNQVLEALEKTQANPLRLKLELTEGVLINDVEGVIAKMTQLKEKGVSFSLDDFGTGYSSLSYLKRLPLDQLKIDKSFVREVLSNPNDAAIARTIVALGQSLNLAVIAEGVETHDQKEFLASSGCFSYQGFHFSHPLPVDHFEQLILQK